MDKVIITEQDILNAKDSISLVLKYTLAKYIAEFSTEKKQIAIKEEGTETVVVPDMVQRNTLFESQFKTGVFVKEYMGKPFDPVQDANGEEIPYLMAADEADAWSNFETQLDRLKRSKDKSVADKCYDILNDYHAFCRMVSIEIEQELQIRNDIVGRFAWLVKYLISNTNPEDMQKTIDELSELQEKLDKKEE